VELPPVIDNTLPPTAGHPLPTPPDYPTQGPVDPAHPDQGFPPLPVRPGHLPAPPPVGIWPPSAPIRPGHPIYPVLPARPGGGAGTLPEPPPGSVWPPLPPDVKGKVLAFAWLVGIGYRWVVLDPGVTLPVEPPVAQPRRASV
jgi:hypothetical protein